MPSDEMVEKVARAICEAWGDDWAIASCSAAFEQYTAMARAALSAAHAEPVGPSLQKVQRTQTEPAGWFQHNDVHGWQQVAKAFEGDEGTTPLYTSPSEAAIRADERAAIRKEAFEEAAGVLDAAAENTPADTLAGNTVRAAYLAGATAIRARGER